MTSQKLELSLIVMSIPPILCCHTAIIDCDEYTPYLVLSHSNH